MIKVNLLRNQGVESGLETEVLDLTGGSDNQKENALKILLMLVFAVALFFYGDWEVGRAQEENQRFVTQQNQLKTKLETLNKQADEAKASQKIILELEDRINVIKDLSKIRLREIKALDFLQSLIPERVWLISLNYDGGTVSLVGNALSDEALNTFVQKLDSRSEFNDVILLKTGEAVSGAGTVKNFELTMALVGQE